MNPVGPTFEGFVDFVRNTMGIDSTVLPDGSQWTSLAYGISLQIVNPQLCAANYGGLPTLPPNTPSMYTLAVYNLGGDTLINYAQDVTPFVSYETPGNNDGLPFFQYLRQKYKVLDFTPGVVESAGDEGTNTSLVVQEAAKNFTLANLQNLKTPYGRAYLAIAQDVGTLWGLS